MNLSKPIRWRMFLPLLTVWIVIPFLEIRISIMHSNDYQMEREYVALYLRFYKWHIEFGLYDTMRRIIERSKDPFETRKNS